jgi:hypothetical protein
MTFEEAAAQGPVRIIAADPGSSASGIVAFDLAGGKPSNLRARYVSNDDIKAPSFAMDLLAEWYLGKGGGGIPAFMAYERLGAQGNFVGEEVFETAAMGGELRRAFRPFVEGIYALRGSEWAHGLTGQGNAKIPLVYAEICAFFEPAGGGSDPYKGVAKQPGPLWDFHRAGKWKEGEDTMVVHLKEALGCGLGFTRVRFRSGKDPETFRRL